MSLLNSINISSNTSNSLSKKMEIVGDNINNAGTAGFKGSRAEFSEVLSSQAMGVDGGQQQGMGAVIDDSTRDISQGTLKSTSSMTDLAIDGKGFFVVETKFGKAYSRDGSFHFDREGHLVNSDGHKVLGFAGKEGQESAAVAPLKISRKELPAKATTNVSMHMNLDARENNKVFDPLDPNETSSYQRSMTVLDSKGEQRNIDVYFTKTADNTWTYNAMVDGADLDPAVDGKQIVGTGAVNFDAQGNMIGDSSMDISANFKDTGNQEINISLTNNGNKTTQLGTTSNVHSNKRDGSEAAGVVGLGFDQGGAMTLRFSNGESEQIGKIAVASFTSEQGLRRVGQNLYTENASSGQASLGKSGEDGRGDVLTSVIEQSNVDLTNNFIDLMTTQKSFSANAQALSAADGLLQKVIALR
ncbi:flagellar hook protein FlgE [Halobacteriovorax sp. HLS]|uniref:flagellar hook protein FlgE n=1 Tax=Halobacteriovorax sp. HLS TaxID=2234000 RepID=UPI000FDCDDAB|nr:flagellar hook protein FlgE [Halobacteriovorax sp. HLS]